MIPHDRDIASICAQGLLAALNKTSLATRDATQRGIKGRTVMRRTSRRSSRHGLRVILTVLLSGGMNLTGPLVGFAQNLPMKLVATGSPPPPLEYALNLSTPSNDAIGIQQTLGGRIIFRSKRFDPVTTDHQLSPNRDAAFAIFNDSRSFRGAILVWRASSRTLSRLVQVGDRTPEGRIFTAIYGLSMNDRGDILFAAETSGPAPRPGFARSGLYLASGATITPVLSSDETTSFGTLLSFTHPRLSDSGVIYFTAQIASSDAQVQQAIFRLRGQTLERLVVSGDRSETGDVIVRPELQAIGPSGGIAFLDESAGTVTAYFASSGVITKIARSGEPVTTDRGPITFERVQGLRPFVLSPRSISPTNEVAFIGTFLGRNDNAVFGLYRFSRGSPLRELLRTPRTIGNFVAQLLTYSFVTDAGLIYCAASMLETGNSAVLTIAPDGRITASQFPGASSTTLNTPPVAINSNGEALFHRINVNLVNPVSGGIRISLNLFVPPRLEPVVADLAAVLPSTTFFDFPALAANNTGTLVFIGNVGGGRNLYMLRNNVVSVVARVGQKIENATITAITTAVINDQGVIAFQAELDIGSGVFVVTGNTIRKLAVTGDLATGSGMPGDPSSMYFTQIFDLAINQRGQIAFIANLSNIPSGPNIPPVRDHAIFLATPGQFGYPTPPPPILSLSNFRVKNSQPLYISRLALGEDGSIVFTAQAERAEGVYLSTVRPGGARDPVRKIVESGDDSPLGMKYATTPPGLLLPSVFSSPRIGTDGTVSFMGVLTPTGDRAAVGIFALRPGGSLEKLVVSGDRVGGETLTVLPLGHTVNTQGDVVFFSGTLEKPGLYLVDNRTRTIRPIVASEVTLPTGETLTPFIVTLPALTTAQTVFFLGSLIGGDSRLALCAVSGQ